MKTKTGKLRPRLDEDSHSNARAQRRPECGAEAAALSSFRDACRLFVCSDLLGFWRGVQDDEDLHAPFL